jgi:hypothetical protein
MSSDSLAELREKLLKLEARLKTILESHKRDLGLAQKLQNHLLPNRTPQIPGLSVFARHIPGSETSHDTFDIITTRDEKELYVVGAWMPQFGLSSVLLQALFHLQSLALVQARPDLSLEELYETIVKGLQDFDAKADFRLSLLKIDIHTLKTDVILHNAPPLLVRYRESGRFQKAINFPENALFNPLAVSAFKASTILRPGARLFYVGTAWNNEAHGDTKFFAPLKFDAMPGDASLVDDISHLARYAEMHQKDKAQFQDVTVLGFEVDAKKIHLA